MEQSTKKNPDGGFFQSLEWKGFQEASGKSTWVFEGVSGTEHQLSFGLGQYGYAPRFPGREVAPETWQKLVAYAESRDWAFLRIEPQSESLLARGVSSLGTRITKAPHDVQPREILMLDITKSEEELLSKMKSKTRYNIRLAKKRGVEVVATRKPEEVRVFLDLLSETAARKEISFHPREYYEHFLKYFDETRCQLLVAKKDGEILAGLLIAYFEETAYYLHGGSGNTGREHMAPYLLQWEAMLQAQVRGIKRYDLGGVAVKTLPPTGKDWSGITRFKQGFAPDTETLVFPGAYDIVISKSLYKLYRILRKLKNIFV